MKQIFYTFKHKESGLYLFINNENVELAELGFAVYKVKNKSLFESILNQSTIDIDIISVDYWMLFKKYFIENIATSSYYKIPLQEFEVVKIEMILNIL